MIFNGVITTTNGDIISCSCGYDAHVLGNILNDNILDVWMHDEEMCKRREARCNGHRRCQKDCNATLFSGGVHLITNQLRLSLKDIREFRKAGNSNDER